MQFSYKNYVLGSIFYRKHAMRGGSMILVNKTLYFKKRDDIVNFSVEREVELSCIELKSYIIVSVYRPPNGQYDIFENVLEDVLKRLDNKNKQLIVLGDFNINILSPSNLNNNLINLFLSFNLVNLFNEPTRIAKNSATCIDNIFYNCDILDKSIFHKLSSDHSGQYILLRQDKVNTNTTISSRHISQNKIETFKTKIITEINALDTNSDDPNFKYNNVLRIIKNNFDLQFPKKNRVCKDRLAFNDWATPGIRKSRDFLYELYGEKSYRHDDDFIKRVRVYSTIFKLVCKQAKCIHIKNQISKSSDKVKTVWTIIKQETGKATQSEPNIVLRKNGCIVEEKSEVANTFANFFSNVPFETTKDLKPRQDRATQLLKAHVDRNAENFSFHQITPAVILKTFKSLKIKNSEDIWGFSVKFIANIIETVAPLLSELFNDCIGKGVFPDLMKCSKILPLFKSGDSKEPGNFRPISILPAFSKIFEKLMLSQLSTFFNCNSLLCDEQFGFSKGFSTTDAITTFVGSIYDAWENCLDVIGVFCDLSKAFDCVDHEILLDKLSHYGIRDNAQKMLKSYLTKRIMQVDINGVLSHATPVNVGVPQGSILGPFLFLVYINDLPLFINRHAKVILFADDTSLLFNISRKLTNTNFINIALNNVFEWFSSNYLALNANKTNCLMFSLGKERIVDPIMINGNNVTLTKTTKFLGLLLDTKLQWGSHIESILGKLSSAAYAIRKIREYSDVQTARIVYFSYFHSLMTYGILLWGNSAESHSIFVLQKRAVRAIYGLGSRVSLRDRFKEINILTMPCQYIMSCLLYARRHLHKYNKFGDSHGYQTRHKDKLVLPMTRLSKISKSFVVNCVRFYNILPVNLTNLNERGFKYRVKYLLLQKAYYSVNHFIEDKKAWQNVTVN